MAKMPAVTSELRPREAPVQQARTVTARPSPPAANVPVPPEEELAAVDVASTAPETPPEPWSDESAEQAFLAEARERGETLPARAAPAETEEKEAKPLPELDALVQRIPAEVRDALEDLFRARFVKVQRVPKRVLKR